MLQALPHKILNRFSSHFFSPAEVVQELDIRNNDRVLEIGSPVGFFAPTLLNKIGSGGSVYVAGPSEEALSKLSHLDVHDQLHPVLLADVVSGKAIEHGSLDLIMLTNLLSKSHHPDTFCLSIGQYLKPDSEIILIDWDTQIKHVGTLSKRRVSREQAVKLLASCGLNFQRVLKIPGYHYGLVFSFNKSK